MELSTCSSLAVVFRKSEQTAQQAAWYRTIQEIRKNIDKSYCRWPLHINLLFPFVNGNVQLVREQLEKLCLPWTPFTYQLGSFSYFEHKHSCSIILQVTNGLHSFQELHRELLLLYPQYQSELDRIGGTYHPHISLGKTKTKKEAEDLIARLSHGWEHFDITLTVNDICWLQRDKQSSFQETFSIKLGEIQQSSNSAAHVAVSSFSIKEKVFSGHWTEIPCWKWLNKEKKWKLVETLPKSKPKKPGSFTLLSYNVLFDDTKKLATIDHATRLGVVLSLLKSLDCDVLALQEVTPSILQQLTDTDWVRQTYYISDTPQNGSSTVHPYGQLILSRFPITKLQILEFSQCKRALMASLDVFGVDTVIVTFHLTAGSIESKDFGLRAHKKRIEQLNTLTTSLCGSNIILAGDWNCGDSADLEEMKKQFSASDLEPYCYAIDTPDTFNDITESHRNSVSSYGDLVTFNPVKNTTASKTMRRETTVSRRIDRICTNMNRFYSRSWMRVGLDPYCSVGGQTREIHFPSDHYGLLSVFAPTEAKKSPLSWKDQHISAFISFKTLIASATPWDDIHCYRVGSSVLGTADENSDIDIVCIGSVHQEVFFSQLECTVHKSCTFERETSMRFVRLVRNALVPIMMIEIDGISLDIQYSRVQNVPSIIRNPLKTLSNMDCVDDASKLALYSVLDSMIILGATKIAGVYDRFVSLCMFLRKWVKDRKLYGGSLGYLSGLSICVLAATSLLFQPQVPKEQNPQEFDLANFFSHFEQWDWSQPVYLPYDSSKFPSCPDPVNVQTQNELVMDVRTPYGGQNIHRNMSRSSFLHLKAEIKANSVSELRELPIECYNNYIERILEGSLLKMVSIDLSEHNASASDVEKEEWLGYCSSRVVNVVMKVEQICGPGFLCLPSMPSKELIELRILQQGQFSFKNTDATITHTVRDSFYKKKSSQMPSSQGKITISVK